MSQEELVDAYVSGRISRRTFIRKLVMGGVSLGAAAAYAGALGPVARAGAPEFYERIHQRVSLKGQVITNEFTGDTLELSGFAEFFLTQVFREGVVRRFDIHFNYAGATARSDSTGEVYRVTGGEKSTSIYNPQQINRVNYTLHLIGKGGVQNLFVHVVVALKLTHRHEVSVEFVHATVSF